MPSNLAKLVRRADKLEKRINLLVEQLGTFMYRAILDALEPYNNLHAQIDDMEARLNKRLKDLTAPDLAKFAVELKKAQDDILKLQIEEDMRLEEMQAHVGGASSFLAPRAIGQAIGVVASSESQTLLTPSPASKVVHVDMLSAPVTTNTTVYIPRVTTPQPFVSDS
ncbi:hypothetical protein HAX54_003115 [Datura stramonium]|uniref:Uncharacterized protein n=1 Tax=Datura stramonium TaxID=4076 RepID=A0ABS8T5J6_DATST|nr:hypothetical protein [Datura stramonium]